MTGVASASAGKWEFNIGFEGFGDTVEAQVQRGKEKMEQSGLQSEGEFDYPPLEGAHAEDFSRLCAADFCLRAALPIDAVESFLDKHEPQLAGGFILADFACGYVSAGLSALEPDGWRALLASCNGSGGSIVLNKAPSEFKKCFDVFGSPRAEWTLFHRLKAALDPHDVFSPGRLPGRK